VRREINNQAKNALKLTLVQYQTKASNKILNQLLKNDSIKHADQLNIWAVSIFGDF